MNIHLGRELLIKRIKGLENNLHNNIDTEKSIHTLRTINHSFVQGILKGDKTKEQILLAEELSHIIFHVLSDYYGDSNEWIEIQSVDIK